MSRNHAVRYLPRRSAVGVADPLTFAVPTFAYGLIAPAYRTMRRAGIPDWRARQLIVNSMLAGKWTQMGGAS